MPNANALRCTANLAFAIEFQTMYMRMCVKRSEWQMNKIFTNDFGIHFSSATSWRVSWVCAQRHIYL